MGPTTIGTTPLAIRAVDGTVAISGASGTSPIRQTLEVVAGRDPDASHGGEHDRDPEHIATRGTHALSSWITDAPTFVGGYVLRLSGGRLEVVNASSR
jgi:hypothetical protein